MKVKILKIVFISTHLRKTDIPKFRGFLAQKYPNYDLIHNHLEDGKLRYSYPQIQFKTINGHPAIIGIKDGIAILKQVFMELNNIKIGDKEETIYEKSISLKEEEFGVAKDYIDYQFLSPWMALNQENYEKYKKIKTILNFDERYRKINELLKGILIGNIISISKSLSYTVEKQINTELLVKEVSTKLKSTEMNAFSGVFKINFFLPDYLGLGKSVSRGFGMMKTIDYSRSKKR